MFHVVVFCAAVASFDIELTEASAFLKRLDTNVQLGHLEAEAERALLAEMEVSLGSEHRAFTEKRLDRIKHALKPIVDAIPKNEFGKLESAAVGYALRRLFLERHAWNVKRLEPKSSAFAEWNETSPLEMYGKKMPETVTRAMRERISQNGLGLNEIAVMAATLEHLVHKEAVMRLTAAYEAEGFTTEDALGAEDVRVIVDTYMSIFILGILAGDVSTLTPAWVRELRQNVTELYPSFPDTQDFVREVQESVLPTRDYYFFSHVVSVVEEIGERYGRWQNGECTTLKESLINMEDTTAGGAGRVRLADFYSAALYKGKWEFVETAGYLRTLGALDESDPNNLKVIVPNYVNGPSNCVASTSFYAVCCIDECQSLLGAVEHQVGAPDASPAHISEIIAALPSATVQGNRVLSTWLLRRLDEVATYHGGHVPLHGRLFAQWLHYAYPRECSFPHVKGSTEKMRGDEYYFSTNLDFSASEELMQEVVLQAQTQAETSTAKPVENATEEELLAMHTSMWSLEEELVVVRGQVESVDSQPTVPRYLMLLSAFASTFLVVWRQSINLGPSKGNDQAFQKYYV